MAYEIRVPSLGESIVEATVARWLKREGEAVAIGEPVVELETDKVNLEVAADQSGVLVSIASPEGTTVAIGDLLGTIEAGALPKPSPAPTPAAAPATSAPTPAAATAPPAPTPAAAPATDEVLATPVAQRMAAEHAIDLRTVQGTGPGGRVTKEDIMRLVSGTGPSEAVAKADEARMKVSHPTPAVIETAPPQPTPPPAPATPPPAPATPPRPTPPPATPVMTTNGNRREERQRLSRRRLTIARRLVEAQHTAAMLTTFNEVDMSAVMALRARHKDSFKERHGVSLGYMSFFTKAVVGALKAFPMVNAEIQGEEVVIKYYYDIGIAVGVDEGLVVPVVRDADRKTFAQIEREIAQLAKKAREGTLSLAELQGGTFTITNGGVYGSLMSTPILNAPQVGILGMHKIEERPVVVNGQIVIRPMMYVALSYDHRLIDGSTAVRFLVKVKELIEDPEALLLEG
ncbi:MAG: dihydrolipoyllysine-residue succinyltransferase component of 2-oxoglutarate dehydrogenase complex [Chloroflexus sp.]|uniref:2-oxoglutarate dehydrogenase complex dihydrolipoyllysine-residue succinyltransferase n=1 Tax=Chloroflexus sp. TaxID=1904827 RepID=UPI0021DC096E|nr:2-oxoglutarate dehydrogenase complex dihydrolipoyllysine-residue succinyltransferase [Chloroflexus sp.]GIV89733.1 MAG: dihydrolipoyllysine-residue succinyltransferase component of 2-oxoglutarate dehydrogenase complex [Chloroflexus sp.]